MHFKVTPGAYLGVITTSMLGRLWWIMIFPCAFFIAGAHNWRFAVIGLIVLMLIYPLAMTTALLTHAMRPEIIRRASATHAVITPTTITLYKSLTPQPDENIPPSDFLDDSPYPTRTPGESASTEAIVAEEELIETLEIHDIVYGRRHTRYIVGPAIHDFILIPTR